MRLTEQREWEKTTQTCQEEIKAYFLRHREGQDEESFFLHCFFTRWGEWYFPSVFSFLSHWEFLFLIRQAGRRLTDNRDTVYRMSLKLAGGRTTDRVLLASSSGQILVWVLLFELRSHWKHVHVCSCQLPRLCCNAASHTLSDRQRSHKQSSPPLSHTHGWGLFFLLLSSYLLLLPIFLLRMENERT